MRFSPTDVMLNLMRRIALLLLIVFAMSGLAVFAQPPTPSPTGVAITLPPALLTTPTILSTPLPSRTAAPPSAITPAFPSLATLIATGAGRTPSPTSIPVFPLRPGSVEGNINDSFPFVRYQFDATAGDNVTLQMETTSGDLDPLLVLYAPDGDVLGRNDDESTGNRNARIALTLTETGTFIVEAARFSQPNAILTAGTFRLTLTIAGSQVAPTPADPLTIPPNFPVSYTILNIQTLVAGRMTTETPLVYYAIAGRQGDLIRIIMTRTGGDLMPSLRLLDRNMQAISREAETTATEATTFVILQETGWHLLEASTQPGTAALGTFDLYATRLAAVPLEVGEAVQSRFEPTAPSLTYRINARIGDQLTFSMFTTESESGVQPRLQLRDVNGTEIASDEGERFVTLQATAPRSGPYILQVDNLATGTAGGFSVRLSSVPLDLAALSTAIIRYNDNANGLIAPETPAQFYRFIGKRGELVTVEMQAAGNNLDPLLILMDNDLNELAANDDAGISGDARIVQFSLPKDGDYLILAARAGLDDGTTAGAYTLTLTAGEIALTDGALTATLRWAAPADLNLFIRDPAGRTLSWTNPAAPSGGVLQVSSNTRCTTLSAQPLEHAFWAGDPLLSGDYTIWVWHQDGCGRADPVAFTLDVAVNGEVQLQAANTLLPRQRFEAGVRVAEDGGSGILEPGVITNPSPQQEASEGGDLLIRYGDTMNGTLSNEQYAMFYQFQGAAGDVITLRAEQVSGDLDPILILRDADNRDLPDGINDDADGTTRNSRLRYTLPADSLYIIAVTRFGVRDGTTQGEFRLSLEDAGAGAES